MGASTKPNSDGLQGKRLASIRWHWFGQSCLFALLGLVFSACSSLEFDPAVARVSALIEDARLQGHLQRLTALGPRRAGDVAATRATIMYLESELSSWGLDHELEVFEATPMTQVVFLTRPEGDSAATEDIEVPDLEVYFAAAAARARVLAGLAETRGLSDVLSGFTIQSVADPSPVELINLLATIPGRLYPERVLEISAHYDTVPATVGADDNTSGVAVLLEVARVLKQNPADYTVRLCFFAAEEIHLVGSKVHIERLRSLGRLDEVIGLINLDAVGFFTDAPESQTSPIRIPLVVWPPRRGNFLGVIGANGSARLANLFEQAGEMYAPQLPIYSLPRLGGYFRDARRSDHANYWDVDIPAIFVTDTGEFRSDRYHRPADGLEGLNLEAMRAVAAMTVAAALEAARL